MKKESGRNPIGRNLIMEEFGCREGSVNATYLEYN